ncbi:MAG: D-alanine--D-alanine ligase [Elusimicrobia bacterium]|nr:D-alanine--D-alanine ligase [Candidatus Obscuribacterium magneticum]
MTDKRLIRWLKRRRVAVLKGGWSTERSISLKTGAAVEEAFKRMGVPAAGIDVRRDIAQVLNKKKVGFCFIGLHGPYGEDGRIQALLDIMGIPYTGSGPVGSALAMDKHLSKILFKQGNVPTAPWIMVQKSRYRQVPEKAVHSIDQLLRRGPLFFKPFDQGSAIGVSKVERVDQIRPALEACYRVSSAALVEEFIPGREITVGILGERALPVVEIVPVHDFYDFHSKYAKGGSRHVVPAQITPEESKWAQEASLKAFRALQCEVYGRVDLILKPNGEVVVLEVNTIPGMTKVSLLPDAARAVGMNFDQLVLDIVRLSMKRGKN